MKNNMDLKWCMNWNEFGINIKEYLSILRDDTRFIDVTLVTDDGEHIQAHKIILSAGSRFFNDIFMKSNQANMLIYLKGIKSVQLKHIIDFIYNRQVSVGQEELKGFLETGKELLVKGFEVDVADVGDCTQEEPTININKAHKIHEHREFITEENVTCDTLEPIVNHRYDISTSKQTEEGISDLNQQITQMIEKSGDGVWICKICGKRASNRRDIRRHAEVHIEGKSHACHLCSKTFTSRPSLRVHISNMHSKSFFCDVCGKAGLNKMSLHNHKLGKHTASSPKYC